MRFLRDLNKQSISLESRKHGSIQQNNLSKTLFGKILRTKMQIYKIFLSENPFDKIFLMKSIDKIFEWKFDFTNYTVF